MENIPARNMNPPESPEKTCEYCGFDIVQDNFCGNIMCENCYLSDSGLVDALREELSKRDGQVKDLKSENELMKIMLQSFQVTHE